MLWSRSLTYWPGINTGNAFIFEDLCIIFTVTSWLRGRRRWWGAIVKLQWPETVNIMVPNAIGRYLLVDGSFEILSDTDDTPYRNEYISKSTVIIVLCYTKNCLIKYFIFSALPSEIFILYAGQCKKSIDMMRHTRDISVMN